MRVLMLMLPVTIGLGLININLLLNTPIASRSSTRSRARSTPPSASTCFLRGCSPSRSRPCSSRSSPGSRPQRLRGPAADRHRHAPDRPAADPLPAGVWRCLRADRAARLPARRVRRRVARHRGRAVGFSFSLAFSGFVLMLKRAFFSLQRPGADAARRRLAGDERPGLLRSGLGVRDRWHRARHDRRPTWRWCSPGRSSLGSAAGVRDARDAGHDGVSGSRGGVRACVLALAPAWTTLPADG